MVKRVFYGNKFSQNALRAEIILSEKGLTYERHEVDLLSGEHKKPEFLKLNPRGQVPTLDDEGLLVIESCAILEYIEKFYPEHSLTPSNRADNAEMYVKLHQFQQKLDNKNLFFAVAFAKQTKDQLKDKIEAFHKELAQWEEGLKEREYFAHTYSLADIAVFPFIATHVVYLGLDLSKSYPRLHKWYQAIESRDAVKKIWTSKVWEAFQVPKILAD